MRIEIKNKNCFNKILGEMFPDLTLPTINGISIDSRNVQINDIFLPLKGTNFDGHQFIPQAKNLGASFVFSEEKIKISIAHHLVSSTKQLLYNLAKEYRSFFDYPIIGITGSNGKTTTKDLLYHVLSESMNTMYSKGNYNSTTGAPLSILAFDITADIGIVEIGASQPGEIKEICKIIQPDLGIITNICNSHLKYFKSKKHISKTKSALFNSLPVNGKAFVNIDDPFIAKMKTSCPQITYSFNSSANYYGQWDSQNKTLLINNNKLSFLNQPYSVMKNGLAVYSIANELGCDKKIIIKKIESFKLPKGRGEIIKLKNYFIINDSYNANLESVKLGIDNLLAFYSNNKKIVVLGDMLELGIKKIEIHKELGNYIAKQNIDIVLGFGELIKHTLYEIKKNENIYIKIFQDKKLLINKLKSILNNNDIVYIKGSRSMAMENIIEGLKL